jgi:predicted dehydrogenase
MPNELWIGHRDTANEDLHRDPSLLSEAAGTYTTYPGGHNEGYDDTFKHSFRAFYDTVAEGDMTAAGPFATFADGHEEVLLCEAILKSHEEERWVEMG